MHESSAGGEEVVVDQNNVILIDGITVEFYGIDTIFMAYAFLMVTEGVFPAYVRARIRIRGLYAITEPPMKPRDSIPTTFVIPLSL